MGKDYKKIFDLTKKDIKKKIKEYEKGYSKSFNSKLAFLEREEELAVLAELKCLLANIEEFEGKKWNNYMFTKEQFKEHKKKLMK